MVEVRELMKKNDLDTAEELQKKSKNNKEHQLLLIMNC